MSDRGKVTVFAVFNFVFAGLCLVVVLVMLVAMLYGLFASGDEGAELATGLIGCMMFLLPSLAGLVVYLAAGAGLLGGRRWGYYAHVVGAVLAVLTCVGVVYTIFALMAAFDEGFKARFFGERGEGPRTGEVGGVRGPSPARPRDSVQTPDARGP